MNNLLLAVAITEGIGFIVVMLRFSYKAGKVIQMIENHERRIEALEVNMKEVSG
jgi:hypothetical protein